jgi:cyclophilin family peptidyl-prolyl cis-trans isomerase
MFEPLEDRALFSASLPPLMPMAAVAPARVATAYTDNRGGVTMTFSAALNVSTLGPKSASLFSPGPDAKLGTADDVRLKTAVKYRGGVLTLSAGVKANRAYRVVLDAKTVRDVNGKALDGEFNGPGVASGNGVAGGNFNVVTKAPAKTAYRFTVITGVGQTSYVNVAMFKNVPNTARNFKHYADEAAWDTTFFHRSTRDATVGLQVVQGGGFNLDSTGNIGSVHEHAGVGLELGNSNLTGTIAMARTSDVNSNTNQWFFNVNDNAALDTFGGGYTAFGKVMDKASQRTLNAINNLTIRKGDPTNSNSPFNELPSLDPTGTIDVPADLVRVTRVAMLMDQAAP